MKEKDILRIIDANLNRFREALRVCEEVNRFIIQDRSSTAKLKKLRHEALRTVAKSRNLRYASLILSRDVKRDIGKKTLPEELKRRDAFDVLSANLQRAKESVRVLEEFLKIKNRGLSLKFKKIRFKIYNIERSLIEKLESPGNIG